MIFSSLTIVTTKKGCTKDLRGSYYNFDVPKLKIWLPKCANFVFRFGQFSIQRKLFVFTVKVCTLV